MVEKTREELLRDILQEARERGDTELIDQAERALLLGIGINEGSDRGDPKRAERDWREKLKRA